MKCCDEPLGLAYLRGLLARRQDIAVHPADALSYDEPPPTLYFYRPGEVLVPANQVPLFEATAQKLGLRIVPSSEAPTGDDRRPTNGDRDAPERFLVVTRDSIDVVLPMLERASGGRLRVSPNHVLFGFPGYCFNPFGEPEPTEHEGHGARHNGAEPSVNVAVLDGGMPEGFIANPLLSGVETAGPAELESWAYSGPSPVLRFPQGHGSAVTGVVVQTSSAARVSTWMAIDGDGTTDEWSLGHQLELVLEDAPAIINLSLGTCTRGDQSLLGLTSLAMASDWGNSPIVVAAAGNNGDDRPCFPAADDWAIAVGAAQLVEWDGALHPAQADFSNFGPWVDVCAPGVNVHTAYESHPYRPEADPTALRSFHGSCRWSGTSFAAPAVTGAIAELLAAEPGLGREGALSALTAGGTAPEVGQIGPFVPWPE